MSEWQSNMTDSYEAFCNLTIDEMHKALKKAINTGAKQIQKTAITNLRRNYNGVDDINPKYSDRLTDNIRLSKATTDSKGKITQAVRAHITRSPRSGSYRMLFLEKGTQDRYLRKNHAYRGRIVAKPFFQPAVQSVLAIWDSLMQSEIDKAVFKINQRKS